MLESLTKAMQFLLADGYVIRSPQQHFMFTNKFYKEYTEKDIGVVATITQVKSETTIITIPVVPADAYMQFILDANVPKRCEGSNNESYVTNQFSDKGSKAFLKILKDGIDLNILTKSTMLYYKTAGYKLKIGNYIGDGTWRTDYTAMMDRIGKNTLKEHIQEELRHDTTGTTKYQFREQPGSQGEGKRIGGEERKKPWDSHNPKQLT